MKIYCPNWKEALEYFLNQAVAAKMARLGLTITKMDWARKEVHIQSTDDEAIMASIASIATKDNPSDGVAVNTTVSADTL